MLILGLTSPEGKTHYIAGAFPSACGKTNLAMMLPTLPGWKVTCVGDDIAWMRIGADGRLYAMNPETGFFGVAPGTSYQSNPNAMDSVHQEQHLHQRGPHRRGRRVVGADGRAGSDACHRLAGQRLDAGVGHRKAAHANSRFTAPAEQCPVIDPNWENPAGVPISAILFGGRRAGTVPWSTRRSIGSTASSWARPPALRPRPPT